MSNRTPRTLSRECPHRFDTGFIPTADYADDRIIVTRNSPLISAVSRKRPGEYRISGGSFIGGGGSREATAYEVAEYLARSPHWAHLMRLTLKWAGTTCIAPWANYEETSTVALAFDVSFAELKFYAQDAMYPESCEYLWWVSVSAKLRVMTEERLRRSTGAT